MSYGVRVKFKNGENWLYCTKDVMFPKKDLGKPLRSGDIIDIDDFFMSYDKAEKLYRLLILQRKEQLSENYYYPDDIDRDFEAIALVEFNSLYKPYSERAVVEYQGF